MYGQITKMIGRQCDVLADDGASYRSSVRPEEYHHAKADSLVRLVIIPTATGKQKRANIHTLFQPPNPFPLDELERFKSWSQEASKTVERALFARTSATEQVVSDGKLFVLGRKGAGKTALGEYLKLSGKYIADVCSFEYFPFATLYKMEVSHGSSRGRYVIIWQILFLSLALAALARSDNVPQTTRNRIGAFLKTVGDKTSKRPIISMLVAFLNWPLLKLSGHAVSFVYSVDPAAVLSTVLKRLDDSLSSTSAYFA